MWIKILVFIIISKISLTQEEILLDFKYIGCSNSSSWSVYVDNLSITDAYLTENYCVAKCNENNFTYAGKRFDNKAKVCYCGNSFSPANNPVCNLYSRYANGNYSNVASLMNYVYEIIEIELDTSSVRANYIGCYNDNKTRDFDKFVNSDYMTIEFCSGFCLSSGNRYFGLQAGNQCFCGKSYGKYGATTGCGAKCRGNNNQICGGNWKNSVYEISRMLCPLSLLCLGVLNKNCQSNYFKKIDKSSLIKVSFVDSVLLQSFPTINDKIACAVICFSVAGCNLYSISNSGCVLFNTILPALSKAYQSYLKDDSATFYKIDC